MTQHVNPQQRSREGSTDRSDVRVPQQARSSERSVDHSVDHSGPIPRPFAHGSVIEERAIPAPRTGSPVPGRSGGVLAPPRPVEKPLERPAAEGPRPPRRVRTTVLVVGTLLAVILLLCGLYAASVVRERSPEAWQVAPFAGLRDVTYTVTTGHGSKVVVSYSLSTTGEYDAGSVTGAASPWRLDTRVNDYYGPSLTATVAPDGADGETNDSITCTIVENGRTASQVTQSGPGASVSCLP